MRIFSRQPGKKAQAKEVCALPAVEYDIGSATYEDVCKSYLREFVSEKSLDDTYRRVFLGREVGPNGFERENTGFGHKGQWAVRCDSIARTCIGSHLAERYDLESVDGRVVSGMPGNVAIAAAVARDLLEPNNAQDLYVNDLNAAVIEEMAHSFGFVHALFDCSGRDQRFFRKFCDMKRFTDYNTVDLGE